MVGKVGPHSDSFGNFRLRNRGLRKLVIGDVWNGWYFSKRFHRISDKVSWNFILLLFWALGVKETAWKGHKHWREHSVACMFIIGWFTALIPAGWMTRRRWMERGLAKAHRTAFKRQIAEYTMWFPCSGVWIAIHNYPQEMLALKSLSILITKSYHVNFTQRKFHSIKQLAGSTTVLLTVKQQLWLDRKLSGSERAGALVR